MTEMLTLDGCFLGIGLCLVASGLAAGRLRSGTRRPQTWGRLRPSGRAGTTLLIVTTLAGLGAYLVTRWPMSVPLTVLGVAGTRGLTRAKAAEEIDRLDAIAVWTEMLRDTLSSAAGLTQALVTTAGLAPRPLRSHLAGLAARLQAGVPLRPALSQLADDVADPAADVVVASLVLAGTERAQRLGELLGALAASTRDEVTMRLGIEAARSSARTSVRMIAGSSFALLALMAVVGRPYLAPYRSAEGQLVLGVVACLYGCGLWLMAVMARPASFPRLHLSTAGAG